MHLENSGVSTAACRLAQLHGLAALVCSLHRWAGRWLYCSGLFPGVPHAPAYCSLKLPEELLTRFGQQNCIQQIETCAVILLFEVFKHELSDCDLRLFCDNIAEQGALIKGFSKSPTQAALCGGVWVRAAASRVGLWIDRVRSKSNIADIPTRPDLKERFAVLRSLSIRCRVPPYSRIIARIEAELSQVGL